MRPVDPHRDQGFAHFRDTYLPLVRPDDMLPQMRRAFEIDRSAHDALHEARPHMLAAQKDWPDEIVRRLLAFGAINEDFTAADHAELRRIYSHHAAQFSEGLFDEAYLDSVEELALFYLFHSVRSVWLAGVYSLLEEGLVDRMFEIGAKKRNHSPRRMMRSFAKAMTLELSQINRVFIAYERAVLNLYAKEAVKLQQSA